jgi:uncharacterized protein (TIGR03083 family)
VTSGADEPVVGLLHDEWDAIVSLGRTLEPGEWDLPTECPGWTVRDVVSHMIGTERVLLGEDPPPRPAELPDYVQNEVGARNEAWVQARRAVPGAEVLKEFEHVTGRRLDALRSWPSERFDQIGPSPVGEVPYREFMRVRVMDCWVHEQDMRVATGRPGHDHGAAAALSLERIASAMPFVVGKKAGAPEGSAVRFELGGAWPKRMDVVVRGGRAVVVDAPDREPDATLVMEAETFWRLGCGRVSGDAARGAALVDLAGDEKLAMAVVDAMAFMI